MEDQEQRKRKRPRTYREPDPSLNKSSIKRISRACDSCRQKKNRCDGVRPTCSQCAVGGLKCMYGAQVRKRGLPTGYVRILEALWAITFRLVPNSEDTALALLRGVSVRYDEEEKVMFESEHLMRDEPLRKIWAQSQLRQRIDQMVSQLENGTDTSLNRQQPSDLLKSSMSSLDDGTAIPIKPWYTNSVPAGHKNRLRLEIDDLDADTAGDDLSDPQQEEGQESISWQETSSIPTRVKEFSLHEPLVRRAPEFHTPDNMWTLIDIYFSYVHCWFPIIQKHTIMKIASSSQDGIIDDDREIALLSAIMAVASSYGHETTSDLSETDAHLHYEVAFEIISHKDILTYNIGIAQVLLLLSIVDMARGKWPSAWNFVGRATRTVLLSKDSKQEALANGDSSGVPALVKRVILGSFILDTIASMHLQTLPHLRSQDVQKCFAFEEDGPDEWDQWINKPHSIPTEICSQASSHQQTPLRALSTFKDYGRLLLILNDAICTSFAAGYLDDADRENFMSSLESWVMNLPRHNQLIPENVRTCTPPKLTPPTANLHLNYAVVLLYLCLPKHSARNDMLCLRNVQVSALCTTSLKGYEEAFGLYQWKTLLELYTGLRTPICALQSLGSTHYNAGRGSISHSFTRVGASPVLSIPYSTQSLQPEPFFRDIDNSAAGKHDMGLSSQVGPPQRDLPPYLHHKDILQVEEMPSSINPQSHTEVLAEHDIPLSGGNPDTMSIDMTVSLSPFNRFQDAGTVESLLEELSSINENDWDMMPSQFMYNLGFYDTEIEG